MNPILTITLKWSQIKTRRLVDAYPDFQSRYSNPPALAGGCLVDHFKMDWYLTTREGNIDCAKRKCTVDPVFGIIKQVLGFRQFSLRGLDAVAG